jgi:hypothetical protein
MAENIQARTSGAPKAINVADYIVQRLNAEGINHCFGVVGDYAFPLRDDKRCGSISAVSCAKVSFWHDLAHSRGENEAYPATVEKPRRLSPIRQNSFVICPNAAVGNATRAGRVAGQEPGG